jgi:hypothetical protein
MILTAIFGEIYLMQSTTGLLSPVLALALVVAPIQAAAYQAQTPSVLTKAQETDQFEQGILAL